MVNRYKEKRGFTLPELLVAMTVLVLVIFAATNLLVTVIRSNSENLNTMIAYGLAQEGLEGVRNMRDSNWLLGARFDGSLKGYAVWGEVFNKTEEEKYYLIDLNSLEKAPFEVTVPSSLGEYTPWKLIAIDESDLGEKTLIRKFALDDAEGGFRYGHAWGAKTGEDTPFHRHVSIRKVPTVYDKAGEINKIRATCVVTWMEGARVKTVRLDTELTDWYEGG